MHPEHGTVSREVAGAYGGFAFKPFRLIGSNTLPPTMRDNLTVALTGTPGVGKSTVASMLEAKGWALVSVEDAAREHDCLGETEVDGAAPVDVHALSEKWAPPEGKVIVDGHLSHFLDVDAVILLRCSPAMLRKRLSSRAYDEAKVKANVEWELTAGHWAELLEFEIELPVLEVDTSERSADVLVIEVESWISEGCPSGSLLETAASAKDWLDD